MEETHAAGAPGEDTTDDESADLRARRAELMTRAREAVQGRPELDAVLDRLQALDEVDLPHHVAELDAVHQVLRDVLAAAGRDRPATS